MLLTLGYVLAGVMIYEYFAENKSKKVSTGSGEDLEQTFLIRSGKGEMTLPPCEIIAVELGPLEAASKAILQIIDKECFVALSEALFPLSLSLTSRLVFFLQRLFLGLLLWSRTQ